MSKNPYICPKCGAEGDSDGELSTLMGFRGAYDGNYKEEIYYCKNDHSWIVIKDPDKEPRIKSEDG